VKREVVDGDFDLESDGITRKDQKSVQVSRI
jgi:hypothetical protein